MNNVNKTLYIPMYGKALVSRRGMLLHDDKAEEIWEAEQFPLRGKAKSKWLAYYMAMRARVFDKWTEERITENPEALVVHIGCGMDARALRISADAVEWYDVDLPAVIEERRKYFAEGERYHMLAADASKTDWVSALPQSKAVIVILEGISMYLTNDEVKSLLCAFRNRFELCYVLMDVYTDFGARVSKYRNPINAVGVSRVYGVSSPEAFVDDNAIRFVGERSMTPVELIDELKGFEKAFFSAMFAGRVAKRTYRLYEYRIG